MQTSAAGLEFVCKQEGEVLHVYLDQVGVPTIGVGHALKAHESYPNGITHGQAIAILKQDLAIAENAINTHVTVELNQNQFDALVSFTFNAGAGALESSTLLQLLNQGNYAAAADELLKWCHGGGRILPVLQRRRQEERALFLKPTEAAPIVEANVDIEKPVHDDPIKPEPTAQPAPAANASIFSFISQIFGGKK